MKYFLFLFLLPICAAAQPVLKGRVVDHDKSPLEALVYFAQHPNLSVRADSSGLFSLPFLYPDTLVVVHVGFTPIKIKVYNNAEPLALAMQPIELGTAEITGRRTDLSFGTLQPHAVENIGTGELKKAPCCNLSEAFETNPAVDVSYTDAVTGAKEIQLLGMRGIYTLMQIEGRPAFYGLSTPFALEFIPGTWLSGIQIGKGTGSALSGYQTIAGQINVGLQRPDLDAPVFVNLYGEQTGRMEANVHLNKAGKNGFSHGLLLHGSRQNRFLDHNHDGFADMPLKHQLNGLYRLRWDLKNWCIETNVHALTDQRRNGQLQMPESEQPFRVHNDIERIEVFGKAGYTGFVEPYRSAGVQASLMYYNQNGVFGARSYRGLQRSAYINAMYATIIGNSEHKITLGSTLQIDDFEEQLAGQPINRRDMVPGVVAEYTHDFFNQAGANKATVVAGMRTDYHSVFGLMWSPRLSFRYGLTSRTVWRLNAGRGYRSPNIVADNLAMLATNRQIHLPDRLFAEQAWNFGTNLTHTFSIGGRDAVINTDLYHTRFEQQLIADYDQSPQDVFLYALDGSSFTTAFLTTFEFFIIEKLSLRLSYKHTDPRMTLEKQGLTDVLLQPRHRALASATWRSPDEKWMLTATTQWTGSQRLPNHSDLPLPYRTFLPDRAPAFFMHLAQASYRAGRTEYYVGCENLAGFTQHNAIIAYDQPQSAFFDATQIYGPTMGRRLYAGVRFTLDKAQ